MMILLTRGIDSAFAFTTMIKVKTRINLTEGKRKKGDLIALFCVVEKRLELRFVSSTAAVPITVFLPLVPFHFKVTVNLYNLQLCGG